MAVALLRALPGSWVMQPKPWDSLDGSREGYLAAMECMGTRDGRCPAVRVPGRRFSSSGGGFRIRLGRPVRVSLTETTLDGRASLARIPGR